RLPLPSGLLPKGSNHIYITVADGSDRTYKIACSPKGLKEITLGRGWQRHRVWRGRMLRLVMTPATSHPQVPTNRPRAPQKPRRRTGCINVPRSAAAAEVEQTFQSEHPYFIMHITERLLHVHFL
ncbi:hypothetical protein S245_039400, partial [Arachis hypogaea]